MIKSKYNSTLIQFISAFTVVLLLSVIFFPAITVEKTSNYEDKCEEKCETEECNEQCESANCGCICCPLVTLGYIIPNPGDRIVLNIESYSIASAPIDIDSEFLKRIDRPPQPSLC